MPKMFVQRKEGVTVSNFEEELYRRAEEATGLPKELLGHNPDIYMHYEDYCKYEINNLEAGVKLFENAVKSKKKIYMYMDYDVDGIGSAVNMQLLCKSLGINATIYIPDREADGYGLNMKFIERIKSECAVEGKEALLMTFDNGIATIDEIAAAKEAGIQVAVFDHHEPKIDEHGEIVWSNADVICDPHVTGGDCVDYCGAGLAYKFAQRCYQDTKLTPEVKEYYLNMMCAQTAISTIADSVPLTLENYHIVEKGLTLISQGKCTYGLKMLCEEPVRNGPGAHKGFSLLGKNLTTSDLSFGLIPALNAWGRMEGDGSRYVAQQLCYNGGFTPKRSEVRDKIVEMNDERKAIQKNSLSKALNNLSEEQKENMSFVVVYDKDCIVGLCGLAAGNLATELKVPCIFLTDDPNNPDLVKGSGRSYGDINIKELLDRLQGYLDHYGGHPAACGLSLPRENIDAFCKAGNEMIERCEVDESVYYDVQCKVADTIKLQAIMSKFMYGVNNPSPVVLIEDVRFDKGELMGQDNGTIKVSQINPVTCDTEIALMQFGGSDILDSMSTYRTETNKFGVTKTYTDQHPDTLVAWGVLNDNVFNNKHTLQLYADGFADERYVERGSAGNLISYMSTDDIWNLLKNAMANGRITGIDISQLNPMEVKDLYDSISQEIEITNEDVGSGR